jgi:hypothetical protein
MYSFTFVVTQVEGKWSFLQNWGLIPEAES